MCKTIRSHGEKRVRAYTWKNMWEHKRQRDQTHGDSCEFFHTCLFCTCFFGQLQTTYYAAQVQRFIQKVLRFRNVQFPHLKIQNQILVPKQINQPKTFSRVSPSSPLSLGNQGWERRPRKLLFFLRISVTSSISAGVGFPEDCRETLRWIVRFAA